MIRPVSVAYKGFPTSARWGWPLVQSLIAPIRAKLKPIMIRPGTDRERIAGSKRCLGEGAPCSHERRLTQEAIAMLYVSEGFTFRNFLVDVFAIFMFVLWFWLLIGIINDLFRRHDISGWGKAVWIIGVIVLPYIAIIAYVIMQARGMAERETQQAQKARDELGRTAGFSVADEIEKLERLNKSGIITQQELTRLRAKLAV